MARICDRCGRGSNRGNNRSHSNVATKRQQFANLQNRRIGGIKMSVCTNCLKTMKKVLREKVEAKMAVKAPVAAKKVVAKKVASKKSKTASKKK